MWIMCLLLDMGDGNVVGDADGYGYGTEMVEIVVERVVRLLLLGIVERA